MVGQISQELVDLCVGTLFAVEPRMRKEAQAVKRHNGASTSHAYGVSGAINALGNAVNSIAF